MTFTIDPNLIENNEVQITEDGSGGLAIKHVPSGQTLTVDDSVSISDVLANGEDFDGQNISSFSNLQSLDTDDISVTNFGLLPEYIIYNRDGETRALKTDTAKEEFNGDADSVISSVFSNLTVGNSVQVQSGNYKLSQSHNIPSGTTVRGTGKDTVFELVDGAGVSKMFQIPAGSNWSGLRFCRLNGNRANNDGSSGLKIRGKTFFPRLDFVLIEDFAEFGITTNSDTGLIEEAKTRNVFIKNCGKAGANFGSFNDASHYGIYVEKCDDTGIKDFGSGNTYIMPHTFANGRNGISISQFSNDITILNPWAENNDQHGIVQEGTRVSLHAPTVFNNSKGSTGTYDGLNITTNADKTTVFGGNYVDTQGTATQRYGINEDDGATDTYLLLPQTEGNVNDGVKLASDTPYNFGATEDLGTSPTTSPTIDVPNGTLVRNSNPDNNETWQLVRGEWVQVA